MSKEKKNKLVPKMRFPEFRNVKEWQVKTLIDVVDTKTKWSFTGGPFGSNLQSSDYTPNGVRIIQLQNIGDAEFIDDYKIFTSEGKADELLSCNIYPGDIIMSKMGDPVGRACLIPNTHGRYVMCSDGIRLVVDQERFSKYFIYSLINSNEFRALVEKTATGSTRKRIGLDDLRNLPMVVPPDLNEQQKIAGCLYSLDDLVTAESQKLEALQLHKKGLMQQLFPTEGEKVPKLRFKEFRGSGEWVEKTLGQVGDVLMCKRIFAEETNTEVGVPFYKIGTLGGKPDAFISHELFAEYKSKYNYPRNDEVLITCSGTVGKCLVYNGEDAYYQDSNIVWIDNPTLEITNGLLFYILSNVNWNRLNSTTITRIYGSDLRGLLISFPKNPKEQQKITDFISSMDESITQQSQKIDTLKAHKKGLMQSLFPTLKD